ncbi:uncharacterized protein LOC118749326 [Rhagoletis pomonella]|uniref:uncharacterized protein LOC118749326 n=1 Tax=Rhagoletis pomonella TaxID=28610 RepID=UPI00177D53CC|nr:uncharacterized protein LOC118749326 [Rhagoletis pomonella]
MPSHPYNLRRDKMSEKEDSASEEELNTTVVSQDTEMDQLREKLKILQASLDASNRENNLLKKEIKSRVDSTDAHLANVTRADVTPGKCSTYAPIFSAAAI